MATIEKNIPIPASRQLPCKPKLQLRLDLESLDVGDSFAEQGKDQKYIGGCIASCSKATGRKFVQRKMGDIVRIWRTE